eukprot:TRINITY_DN47120_c0_g1_i1.p1 TRINITY_DN47120_c0_g1~~TRINITY_DN47120_c0_g1_i1.p1  ORF type:complete len:775 (+),score=117.93 TRINITY_DN47120_c0_g1_i1:149-2473(+)
MHIACLFSLLAFAHSASNLLSTSPLVPSHRCVADRPAPYAPVSLQLTITEFNPFVPSFIFPCPGTSAPFNLTRNKNALCSWKSDPFGHATSTCVGRVITCRSTGGTYWSGCSLFSDIKGSTCSAIPVPFPPGGESFGGFNQFSYPLPPQQDQVSIWPFRQTLTTQPQSFTFRVQRSFAKTSMTATVQQVAPFPPLTCGNCRVDAYEECDGGIGCSPWCRCLDWGHHPDQNGPGCTNCSAERVGSHRTVTTAPVDHVPGKAEIPLGDSGIVGLTFSSGCAPSGSPVSNVFSAAALVWRCLTGTVSVALNVGRRDVTVSTFADCSPTCLRRNVSFEDSMRMSVSMGLGSVGALQTLIGSIVSGGVSTAWTVWRLGERLKKVRRAVEVGDALADLDDLVELWRDAILDGRIPLLPSYAAAGEQCRAEGSAPVTMRRNLGDCALKTAPGAGVTVEIMGYAYGIGSPSVWKRLWGRRRGAGDVDDLPNEDRADDVVEGGGVDTPGARAGALPPPPPSPSSECPPTPDPPVMCTTFGAFGCPCVATTNASAHLYLHIDPDSLNNHTTSFIPADVPVPSSDVAAAAADDAMDALVARMLTASGLRPEDTVVYAMRRVPPRLSLSVTHPLLTSTFNRAALEYAKKDLGDANASTRAAEVPTSPVTYASGVVFTLVWPDVVDAPPSWNVSLSLGRRNNGQAVGVQSLVPVEGMFAPGVVLNPVAEFTPTALPEEGLFESLHTAYALWGFVAAAAGCCVLCCAFCAIRARKRRAVSVPPSYSRF